MPRFQTQWNHRNYSHQEGDWSEYQSNYDQQWDMSEDWSDEGPDPLNYNIGAHESSFKNEQNYEALFHNGRNYEESQGNHRYQRNHPKWTCYSSGHPRSDYFKGKPLVKYHAKYNKTFNQRLFECRGGGNEREKRRHHPHDAWRGQMSVDKYQQRWVAMDDVKGGTWKGYQSRKSGEAPRRGSHLQSGKGEGVGEEERYFKTEKQQSEKEEGREEVSATEKNKLQSVTCTKCNCQKGTSEAPKRTQNTDSLDTNNSLDYDNRKSQPTTQHSTTQNKSGSLRAKGLSGKTHVSSNGTLQREMTRMEKVKTFTIPKKKVSNNNNDDKGPPGRGENPLSGSVLPSPTTTQLKIIEKEPCCSANKKAEKEAQAIPPSLATKELTNKSKKEMLTPKQTLDQSLQNLVPLASLRQKRSASQTYTKTSSEEVKRKIKDVSELQEQKKSKPSKDKQSQVKRSEEVKRLFKPPKSEPVAKKQSEKKVSELSGNNSPTQPSYSISIPVKEGADSVGKSSGLKMLFTKSPKSELKNRSKTNDSKTSNEKKVSPKTTTSQSAKKEKKLSQGFKTKQVVKKKETPKFLNNVTKVKSESALETIGICLSNQVSIKMDNCEVSKLRVTSNTLKDTEINKGYDSGKKRSSFEEESGQKRNVLHKTRNDKEKVEKVSQVKPQIEIPPCRLVTEKTQAIKHPSQNVQLILLNGPDRQLVYRLKEEPGTVSHSLNTNILQGELISPETPFNLAQPQETLKPPPHSLPLTLIHHNLDERNPDWCRPPIDYDATLSSTPHNYPQALNYPHPLYYNLGGVCYNRLPVAIPPHPHLGSPTLNSPQQVCCCDLRLTNTDPPNCVLKSDYSIDDLSKTLPTQTREATPNESPQFVELLSNSPIKNALTVEETPLTTPPDSNCFICERCSIKLASFFSLAIHMKTHEDFDPYQCDKCTEIFLQHSKFLHHLESHGDNTHLDQLINEPPRTFQVDVCAPDSISQVDPLDVTPGKNSFTLSPSQIKGSSENTVSSSSQSYTGRKEKVENTRKYPCDYCPEVYKSKKNLVKHLSLHKEKDLNICKECDKIFSSSTGLKRHMINHKRKTLNICPFCFKGFISPTVLESHVRLHDQEGLNSCVYCSKHFKKERSLMRHIKSCPKGKLFECVDCRQTFVSASTFERHVKSHSDEMAYKCSSCQKSFCSDMELMDHFKSHAGQQEVFAPQLTSTQFDDALEACPSASETQVGSSTDLPSSSNQTHFHPTNFTPVHIDSLFPQEHLNPATIKLESVQEPHSFLNEFQDNSELKIEVKEEWFD